MIEHTDGRLVTAIVRRRWVSSTICALSLLLLGCGETLSLVADPGAVITNVIGGSAYVLGYAVVGLLLTRRLPRNPIGWCFSLSTLASAIGYVAHGWVALALTRHYELGSLARAGAVFDAWGWIVEASSGAALPLLLLPDGRLLSRRWRPVAWVLVGGSVIGLLGYLTTPGPINTNIYRQVVNPFGLTVLGPLPRITAYTGVGILLLGTGAGIVALVLRYRRSANLQRQQLRWVACGGGITLLGVGYNLFRIDTFDGLVAGMIAAAAIPVCIGVAVLRYRLFDLGRLVSRTVTYAVVTGLLLAAYVGLVTGASRLLPSSESSNSLAVAGSTLAVAALFQPLRRRVQRGVDRRFNRAGYDAEHTVEMFTRRMRDEVSLAAMQADIVAVVTQTMQPASVGIWLRPAAPSSGARPGAARTA